MYWSIYAILSFACGLISLFTVVRWYICFPFAILSFLFVIVGHKLGGTEMNIFGVVTSSCAVGLYIVLTAFTYVAVMADTASRIDGTKLMNRIDISQELEETFNSN